MTQTFEMMPQIIMTVGGMPAVCHNLACSFEYVVPAAIITAFTHDSATFKIVITGTDLPTDIAEIASIKFAQTTCTVDASTLSATNIECTLASVGTCGSYSPIVMSTMGLIPVDAGVTNVDVDCTIT
jgi:hypothetical protein